MPLITPDKIADTLIQYLDDENTIFVFPTDIAASTWADWIVTHKEISKTDAVALERFTAWDKFKSENLSATQKGKKSIPAILRKLFARNLIKENAAASENGDAIFKSLIVKKYAQNAYAFTDWIASLLPSLKRWHEKFSAHDIVPDEEDFDYIFLYNKYSEYLERQNLFEPAWLSPDFTSLKNNAVIFFPELLEDYEDYRELFEKIDAIKIYSLEKENIEDTSVPHPTVNFFSNARTELRALCLQIKKLEAEGVSWENIAINVPEISVWRPYLERELSLYAIPFVTRSGEPLTKNSAGKIFSEMIDCIASDFSYDSVRALLLDEYIPWKNISLNEELVRLGNECSCVLGSYTENGKKIDVWQKALSGISDGFVIDANTGMSALDFYKKLRHEIEAIYYSATFSDVQIAWFAFKNNFLDSKKFSDQANLIIGRCMSELSVLIEIEKEFILAKGESVYKPFEFFTTELEKKTYQPQEKKSGASIFPYKLAAAAPFEYQFVVDSSQKSLTVDYKSMQFLSKQKRQMLGIHEEDVASDCFVRMYAGKGSCVFSGATETFKGFSIPYSYFQKASKNSNQISSLLSELSEYDLVMAEKKLFEKFFASENFFASGEASTSKNDFSNSNSNTNKIIRYQKNGFDSWRENSGKAEKKYSVSKNVQSTIKQTLVEARKKFDDDFEKADSKKMHITQTDLKNFFPCPRKWLFQTPLCFSEDSLDAELMGRYDHGNIIHKILELFMKLYEGKNLPATVAEKSLFENEVEIRSTVSKCAVDAFCDERSDFSLKPIVISMLESQKNKFVDVVMNFLHTFCLLENFGGWTVAATEKSLGGILRKSDSLDIGDDWSFDKDFKEWTFAGKIDCVLRSSIGNELAIVDYKTGNTPEPKDCIVNEEGELSDFQMAVYVTLLSISDMNKTKKIVSNALFWKVSEDEPKVVVSDEPVKKSVTAEEFVPTLKAVHEKANDFYKQVKIFDLSPKKSEVKSFIDCISCKFNPICRTTYSVSNCELD